MDSTVKPAGTLSLLGKCTSGVNPGYAPLVNVVKEHVYDIEYVKNFDVTRPYNKCYLISL